MDINLLKNKITLQEPIITENNYGTKQEISYTGVEITIWAQVTYIGGNKTIQNYELFASQTIQFTIRNRSDFNENWRIVFNNKYYSILNIKSFTDSMVITAELL